MRIAQDNQRIDIYNMGTTLDNHTTQMHQVERTLTQQNTRLAQLAKILQKENQATRHSIQKQAEFMEDLYNQLSDIKAKLEEPQNHARLSKRRRDTSPPIEPHSSTPVENESPIPNNQAEYFHTNQYGHTSTDTQVKTRYPYPSARTVPFVSQYRSFLQNRNDTQQTDVRINSQINNPSNLGFKPVTTPTHTIGSQITDTSSQLTRLPTLTPNNIAFKTDGEIQLKCSAHKSDTSHSHSCQAIL